MFGFFLLIAFQNSKINKVILGKLDKLITNIENVSDYWF